MLRMKSRRAPGGSRASRPAPSDGKGKRRPIGGRPQRACAAGLFGYNAWNRTVRKGAGAGVPPLGRARSAAASSGGTEPWA